MYIKSMNGKTVVYSGPSFGLAAMLAAGWIRHEGDEPVERLVIEPDGTVTVLPEFPVEPHEWVDTEELVSALYTVIPPAKVAEVLQQPEACKSAVAGMALLTSKAAPGCVDLCDPRVAAFCALAGVTVDQVRAAIAKVSNVQ